MIMKFLLKYGYEFGMSSGPQGEMGFTKTYYHNGSEVLWVTINPNTYKVHFYNEYDCGGLLNKWIVCIPKSTTSKLKHRCLLRIFHILNC